MIICWGSPKQNLACTQSRIYRRGDVIPEQSLRWLCIIGPFHENGKGELAFHFGFGRFSRFGDFASDDGLMSEHFLRDDELKRKWNVHKDCTENAIAAHDWQRESKGIEYKSYKRTTNLRSQSRSAPHHLIEAKIIKVFHISMNSPLYSLIRSTPFKISESSSEWYIKQQILFCVKCFHSRENARWKEKARFRWFGREIWEHIVPDFWICHLTQF
jgi:hypothetical protein